MGVRLLDGLQPFELHRPYPDGGQEYTMQQVIYLDVGDDLSAIRHLLEGAQARRVLLVIPKGSYALRDKLNVRVLKRYADELAVDVALVSRDSRTRQVAKEEGVSVVSSVRSGKRGRWRSKPPRRSPAEQAAAVRVAALRSGRGDVGYGDAAIVWAGRILGVLLFVGLLAVILALGALVVPEARITLVPYRQPVETTLQLRADPEVEKASLAELTIPARIVEVEVADTGAIATVSKRDAPDAPATGSVIFINQTTEPIQILPGAVIRTSTGTTVRFRTVTTATLLSSIGATAEAEIEALQPGPAGNVAAATINEVETSALRGKVRVINEQPTQGGGVKQVGVVTRADMDRLKAQLLQELQRQAFFELQAQLGEQEFLPPESLTIEIMSEVFDQFLDSEADVLNLQMRIVASGTAVDGANANLLAYDSLNSRIPATYELRSEEVAFERSEQVQMDGRSVLFEVQASAQLVADVDRRAVRAAVAGLPADEAIQALEDEFALDAPPAVEVQPDWIKRWQWLDRVPFSSFRIQVVVLE